MKRLFDIIFSATGIVLLLPIMLLVLIIIKIFSPTPVLFKQQRIGLNGNYFYLYKFCTMKNDNTENSSHLTVQNNPRITKVGKTLRKWKFDELPSLFNVFKGDMSFVGPRPWVKHYIDKLNEEEKKFLKMRPGITSPATLKYANEEYLLSDKDNPEKYHDKYILPDKIALNLEYYKKNNLIIDIGIIFRTIFRRNY